MRPQDFNFLKEIINKDSMETYPHSYYVEDGVIKMIHNKRTGMFYVKVGNIFTNVMNLNAHEILEAL